MKHWFVLNYIFFKRAKWFSLTSGLYFFCVFRSDGTLHFECVNLNSLSNWFTELPEGKVVAPCCLRSVVLELFFFLLLNTLL